MLKPCRECSKEVSTEAVNCPHCGAPISAVSPKEKSGCGKAVLWAAGIVFGLFVIAQLLPEPVHNTALDACVNVQMAVKDRLKAPSTADFSNCPDATTTFKAGDTTYVTGYVDSENGFGAKLRSRYSGTARFDGTRWSATDVLIF